jgi:hypothetical protein
MIICNVYDDVEFSLLSSRLPTLDVDMYSDAWCNRE